jgi:hypothetical protein
MKRNVKQKAKASKEVKQPDENRAPCKQFACTSQAEISIAEKTMVTRQLDTDNVYLGIVDCNNSVTW